MSRTILALVAVLAAAGCAQQGSGGGGPTASATQGDICTVKSTDGSFDGEVIGTPAPGSKFAKVKIGMRSAEVERLIGPPDDSESHITGRTFIPFFFGGDTQRREAFYQGEGILTYSPAHFAGESNVLIRVIADPTEKGIAH